MNAKVMLSDAYTPPISNGLGWNIIGQRELTSAGTYSHFVDYNSYASIMSVVTVPKGVPLQYIKLASTNYYWFIYSSRGNYVFTKDNSFCMTFNRITQYIGITDSYRRWNAMIGGLVYKPEGTSETTPIGTFDSSYKFDEVALLQYTTEPFPAPVIQTVYGLR